MIGTLPTEVIATRVFNLYVFGEKSHKEIARTYIGIAETTFRIANCQSKEITDKRKETISNQKNVAMKQSMANKLAR